MLLRVKNIAGGIAIDLAATDAQANKQVQQQMQLSIIQIMMGYLEKVLQVALAGNQALQQGDTTTAEMIKEVMSSAHSMFSDLLAKYDIRNPEDYLPDLERFLNGPQGNVGEEPGNVGGVQGQPALPGFPGNGGGSLVPTPGRPGEGAVVGGDLPFTG